MTHARQRLRLLALGVLAPVVAFGAIALSAPPASADGDYPANPYENPCNYAGVYCDPRASSPWEDPSYLLGAWVADANLFLSWQLQVIDSLNGICGLYVYCP